jgi:hypothetical protein
MINFCRTRRELTIFSVWDFPATKRAEGSAGRKSCLTWICALIFIAPQNKARMPQNVVAKNSRLRFDHSKFISSGECFRLMR